MSEPRPTPAPLEAVIERLRRIRDSRASMAQQYGSGLPPDDRLFAAAAKERATLALDALAIDDALAALAPPPPAAPHGYVPTREEAIADITYVRNMLQWHQEKSVQWVPEIEKLNYALEYLAATLPGSTPECQGQLIEGGYFVCPRCGPGHVSECGAALPASAPAKGRVSECVAHGVLACEVCLTDEAFRAASPLAPALPETE